MQGTDQILLKVATIHLSSLENHFGRVNEDYLCKIKTLKQLLRQKEMKQNALKQSINSLKEQYEQHNREVKRTLQEINQQQPYYYHFALKPTNLTNTLAAQKSVDSSFMRKTMEDKETATLTPKHQYSQKMIFAKQGELLVKSAQLTASNKYREKQGQLKTQTRILLGKNEPEKINKFRSSFQFSRGTNPKQKNDKIKAKKLTRSPCNPEQKTNRK